MTHFPIYVTDPKLTFKFGSAAHTAYIEAGCDRIPSLVTQWQNNACRGPLIAAKVEVPMRVLEEALVNALDIIGYLTRYEGLFAHQMPYTTLNDTDGSEDASAEPDVDY